ncbi:MAG: GGDEF domain-containing protein [Lachnospiraceae bacterium]|nr:GGDEF domain-containing protein [Lachnospiraceae bacterium]
MPKYIQMLSSTWNSEYLTALVNGIGRRLENEDICLHIFNAYDDIIEKNFYILDREIFSLPSPDNYAGMIAVFNSVDATRAISEYVNRFKQSGKPVLTIDQHVDDIPFFGIDNYQSMYDIVEHMVTYHKCRTLNYVGGPATNEENQLRYKAYIDCLTAHDIPIDYNRIRHYRFLIEDGIQAYRDFRALGLHLPDAVICANDHMAYGYCSEAARDGYECPEDFRLTGFDNVSIGQDFIPSITSINRSWTKLGYDAADGLINMIKSGRLVYEHFTNGRVVTNESCGCGMSTRNLRMDYLKILTSARKRQDDAARFDTARKILLSTPGLREFRQSIFRTVKTLGIPSYALCLNEDFFNTDSFDATEPFSRIMKACMEDSTEDIDTTVSLLPSAFSSYEKKMYIFAAVHFDSQTFGYCVMPFDSGFIATGGHRSLMDNISLSLVNIKQRVALDTMNEQLRDLYVRDALTGLYNRFGYTEFLPTLYEGGNSRIFVMCMDLDNLKRINDTYGHSYGDKAIRALADAILANFDEADIKVRMGGDEFTVIGNYLSDAMLDKQQENIRDYLMEFIRANDFPMPIEASIAYASGNDITDDQKLEELTHEADKRMYEVKQAHHSRQSSLS